MTQVPKADGVARPTARRDSSRAFNSLRRGALIGAAAAALAAAAAVPAFASGPPGGTGASGGSLSGGGGANSGGSGGGGGGGGGSLPAPPKPVPGHEPPSSPCGFGAMNVAVGSAFFPFVDFTYDIDNINCPGGGLLWTLTFTDTTTGQVVLSQNGGESSGIVRQFSIPNPVVGDTYVGDLSLTDGKGVFVEEVSASGSIPSAS
jgi:hypothetical protein